MRDDRPIVTTAVELARRAHADQRRKGPGEVPYFTHLESVAERLRAFSYDDEITIAAAYLHDLIEDRPAFTDELRSRLPAPVVETVEVLTEQKRDAAGRRRGKPDRFRDYVAALGSGSRAAERAVVLRGWLPGRAVAIAAEAHLGQTDKAGAPYVLHPLRLMLRARTPLERMVAVLHDVIEDTPWTLEALGDEGFPAEVIGALDRLTRRQGESYERFIERIAEDPLAARVKLLDLEDNMDATRLGELGADEVARLQRYHRARRRLLARGAS